MRLLAQKSDNVLFGCTPGFLRSGDRHTGIEGEPHYRRFSCRLGTWRFLPGQAKFCCSVSSLGEKIMPEVDYIELNNRGQRLRFSLTEPIHRLGRDSQWADLAVPGTGWEVISNRHAVFRRQGDRYVLYDGDGEGNPSRNGIFTHHTRVKTDNGYELNPRDILSIGQDPSNLISLTYRNRSEPSNSAIPSHYRLDLGSLQDWPVQIGRERSEAYSSMVLDAPTVSRLHATIERQGTHYLLHDRGTNGTFINRQRLTRPHRLADGDIVQIGPFTLLFRQNILELFDSGESIRLDVDRLVREVRYASTQRTILNNVSLAIEPGQLAAIVGGSGAGKSTLLKTLLGIEPLTRGAVFLNGDNLRQNFDLYRSKIGYVPQDDIVHEQLTVEEVLTYAIALRLPPDADREELIRRTLEQVKLTHVRKTSVQNLSGGQRKRVSIAVELLADPKLFFLDEPTSGLDPGLDRKMMQLLRELADRGRTVILVTHATSNLDVCDRLVFMAAGGRLCYFGPPQEAINFFAMPSIDLNDFADIYIELDRGDTNEERQKNVAKWAEKFEASTVYRTYVMNALSQAVNPTPKGGKKSSQDIFATGRQWWVLTRRSLTLMLRDRFNLALMLLTAPIGIALIAFAVRNETPLAKLDTPDIAQPRLALSVLFVFTCAQLWVGLSETAQSIVKENSIYARERLANLGIIPYLAAKFSLYSGLALIQSLLITFVIILGFESPPDNLTTWEIGLTITNFLTLMASFCLGIMVSSFAKNSNQANSSLPLILIPQIIFSGVLFELTGITKNFSWLTIGRWSMGAYASLVKVNNMVPESAGIEGVFTANPSYAATWKNLGLNWQLLLVHSLVYLIVTFWQQKRKDSV
jgi:ABC transport system ATP-binding/permease protein